MSMMIILAQKGQLKGIFTQRKILWGILEELEGKPITVGMDEITSLVIQSDAGRIVSTTGSEKRYTKCTYANLCSVMRTVNKVALHNAETFEPIYALWQSEPNEKIGE